MSAPPTTETCARCPYPCRNLLKANDRAPSHRNLPPILSPKEEPCEAESGRSISRFLVRRRTRFAHPSTLHRDPPELAPCIWRMEAVVRIKRSTSTRFLHPQRLPRPASLKGLVDAPSHAPSDRMITSLLSPLEHRPICATGDCAPQALFRHTLGMTRRRRQISQRWRPRRYAAMLARHERPKQRVGACCCCLLQGAPSLADVLSWWWCCRRFC